MRLLRRGGLSRLWGAAELEVRQIAQCCNIDVRRGRVGHLLVVDPAALRVTQNGPCDVQLLHPTRVGGDARGKSAINLLRYGSTVVAAVESNRLVEVIMRHVQGPFVYLSSG